MFDKSLLLLVEMKMKDLFHQDDVMIRTGLRGAFPEEDLQ
jgi:hypothetical protein